MLLASQLPDTFLLVTAGAGSILLIRVLRWLRGRNRGEPLRPRASDD
jgi:hypothetical protein